MKDKTRTNPRTLARLLGALAAAPLLAMAGSASAASASAYGESAMLKLKQSDAAPPTQGVGLSAARNEFVSFQVVVNGGDSGAKGVSASLDQLSGPGTISGGDVRLYREAYLTTTTPSTPDVATGAWPDGLIPAVDEIANEPRQAFPFDVAANQSGAIWVDVHVPDSAAPGVYTGTVQVSGGVSASVPVTLTVVDASLPSTASLKTAFLLSSGNVCTAHAGSNDCGGNYDQMRDLLGKYEQMALEHRITLSNITPNAPQSGDWSQTDQWIGAYMDGTAPSRLAGAKMTSVQYQGQPDATLYGAFAQHMKDKGWFDRAYVYSADEPPYGSSYADAASREALAKQADPNLRTLVTTTAANADANGLSQDLNIIVPVVNWIDGTGAPYQGDQASTYGNFLSQPGKELWLYESCMSHGCAYGTNQAGGSSVQWPSYMVDASTAQNRAMQWVDFLEGATGELYYETAMALPTAWTDQYQFAGNGDGTLFYPGTTNVIGGNTDVPIASIRLKLIRLGEEDFEWLKLVSDAGDPTFARQVARTLLPTAHDVPTDGSAFDRARLQLISRYLELTQKPAAQQGVPGAPPSQASAPPQQAISGGTDPVSGQSTSTMSSTSSTAAGASLGKAPKGVKGGCASGGGALSLLGLLGALVPLARRRRR